MKTILTRVEVPDTIPDPELNIEARCAGTFDEWEEVPFETISLPTEEEIETMAKAKPISSGHICNRKHGANFVINKFKAQ